MKVIAVIGHSGSGKTTAIEYLTKKLASQGYRIGVMKHVHHPNFTIDTEGKDTWRHARAGAKIVSTVSSDEVTIIRKTTQHQRRLDDLLDLFKKDELDLLFLEGFHHSVAGRRDIHKIISAKSQVDLAHVLKNDLDPILAITGHISTREVPFLRPKSPMVDIMKEGQELIRIIKRDVLGRTRRHLREAL